MDTDDIWEEVAVEQGEIKEDPKKRTIEEISNEVKPTKKSKKKNNVAFDKDLYVKKTVNPQTKNLDISNAVALWESKSINSPDFVKHVQLIIEHHYPTDKKTLLDYVLAYFLLYHPEHIDTVLPVIVTLIYNHKLVYHSKQPPFYSFLTLFSIPVIQSTSSDSLQRKLLISIHNANISPQSKFILSPWIHDILMHTTEELLNFYINYIVNEYRNSSETSAKRVQLECILNLTHEATKDRSSLSILDALVPTILNQLDQLDDFKDIIAKFFEYQTSQNKLNDIISSVLLTKDSDSKLIGIIHYIVDRLPNTAWLVQSLLPIIISNLSKNNSNADKVFASILKDDKLSCMIFSIQNTIEKDISPLKVTIDCILNKENKVFSILESIWKNSSSTKIWRELRALMTQYEANTSLVVFIDSSFGKLLEYLVIENSEESFGTLRSIIHVFLYEFMSKSYSKLIGMLISFLSKSSDNPLTNRGTLYLRDQLSCLHLMDVTYVPVQQFTKSLLLFHSELKKHDLNVESHNKAISTLLSILEQLYNTANSSDYLRNILQDSLVLNSLIKLCDSAEESIRYNVVCLFHLFYTQKSSIPSDFWNEFTIGSIVKRIEDKNRKIPTLIAQFVKNLVKESPSLVPLVVSAISLQLLQPSVISLNAPSVSELKMLLTIILTSYPQYAELVLTIVKSKLFTHKSKKIAQDDFDVTIMSAVNPFSLIVVDCLLKLKIPIEDALIDLLIVDMHNNKTTNETLYKIQTGIINYSNSNKMQVPPLVNVMVADAKVEGLLFSAMCCTEYINKLSILRNIKPTCSKNKQ